MNNAHLEPLKNFIGQDEGFLLGGAFDVTNQDLSQKLKPSSISLTSAARFHVNVNDDILFSDLILCVDITPDKTTTSKTASWNLAPSFKGKVTLGNLGYNAVDLDCRILYAKKTLEVSAQTAETEGLFGIPSLSLKNLQAKFSIGSVKSLQLQANIDAADTTYELDGILTKKHSALYTSIGDFELADLEALFHQITSLRLALPDFDVTFKEVYMGLTTGKCTIGKQTLEEGVTLGAKLQVHGHVCQALARISSSGIAFTGALGELKMGPVALKKAKLEMEFFTKASGRPVKFAIVGC
jgi:hypothetical protein